MIVHALNQWSTDKMMAFMKYCWGDTNKVTKSASLEFLPVQNTIWGNLAALLLGRYQEWYLEMPSGPCKVWHMDFILPLSHGYKRVLVMVRMFSHWTKAFPCR